MTAYVRKPKEFPDTPPPTEEEIAAWESARGTRLDPDYRYFLRTYNGGFIFPEIFNPEFSDGHPYFEEYDRDDVIEDLHNWQDFVTANSSNQLFDSKAFVEIGFSMNGVILSRTIQPDNGSVHLWCRNSEFWMQKDGLEVTGRVSGSFRSFIESALHENDERSARWFHPSHFQGAREIVFKDQ